MHSYLGLEKNGLLKSEILSESLRQINLNFQIGIVLVSQLNPSTQKNSGRTLQKVWSQLFVSFVLVIFVVGRKVVVWANHWVKYPQTFRFAFFLVRILKCPLTFDDSVRLHVSEFPGHFLSQIPCPWKRQKIHVWNVIESFKNRSPFSKCLIWDVPRWWLIPGNDF